MFVAKLLVLSLPCAPYATKAWLLYPLLGVAALDLGILPFDLRRSVLLLGVHLAVVFVAHQHGYRCERPAMMWDNI